MLKLEKENNDENLFDRMKKEAHKSKSKDRERSKT